MLKPLLTGCLTVLMLSQWVYAQIQPATGTIDIVAVMVEFEPDDNRFTTGDGTFNPGYLDSPDIVIDPLPHDQGYFEAHLEFVKNYFETVSGSVLTISYQVVPQVFRLPEPMAAYSPLGTDNTENFKLALLARDTWNLVRQSGALDAFSGDPQRTMFVVFHAGAGRDLELIGTSLTKTPQDIPSVFLDNESLSRLLNDPLFDGFIINNNGLKASHTAILPETQSRPGTDILGNPFVLELSINGITTAMVGSYLGLPDLFNTETGQSGIGRFGLMDGAGFFSYFGLFPPEPSAWEKIVLGWQTPVDIDLNAGTPVLLPAAVLRQPNAIARHRISADEYFLIENRHRDPDGTGVTLTIRKPDGTLQDVPIDNREDRFSPFDLSRAGEILPPGVLINVSNFDWSLPGGYDVGEDRIEDTDDDRLLNGGMLIWHIDESIIRENSTANTINNNPKRRGVNLVEADAAQDIGRPAGNLTQYDQGAPFDFWWSGNDFTVITQSGQRIVRYQNRFADDTTPNNRSATGAFSGFEWYDFSDNLPTASFIARPAFPNTGIIPQHTGNTIILPQTAYQIQAYTAGFPLDIQVATVGSDTLAAFFSPEFIQLWNTALDSVYVLPFDRVQRPLLVQPHPDTLEIYVTGSQNAGSVSGFTAKYTVDTAFTVTQSWVNTSHPSAGGLISAGPNGTINLERTPIRLRASDGSTAELLPQPFQSAFGNAGSLNGNQILNTTGNSLRTLSNPERTNRLYLAPIVKSQGEVPALLVYDSNENLTLLEQDPLKPGTALITQKTHYMPAIADITGDGFQDIIFVDFDSRLLNGINLNGAVLPYFPIEAPAPFRFTGTPLLVDTDGNGRQEMLVMAHDGYSLVVFAYDAKGSVMAGFPLLVGGMSTGFPATSQLDALNITFFNNRLYAVSPTGGIKIWEFQNAGAQHAWPTAYGPAGGNKLAALFTGTTTPVNPDFQLLSKTETYNWPNPASDETFIRFEAAAGASVEITVISIDGGIVYKDQRTGSGTQPQEIRLDTGDWGNGLYYCRVLAKKDGKTDFHTFKLVVMR